jgi:peptidoglycan/LPS O-acetylase OafA/YrhL
MGSLRLFLALAVIASHTMTTGQVPWITGNLAVRLFFMVSGFYMALILSGKYSTSTASGLRLFYSNRALRIFPLLWLCLVLDVLLLFLFRSFGWTWDIWPELLAQLCEGGHWVAVSLLGFARLSAFGIDLVPLFNFGAEGQAALYDGPPVEGGFRAWMALPMSHTWSISCELVFYLIAPWLVRLRNYALILLILVSWMLAPLVSKGLDMPALANVASSFFGPFQLTYFLLGLLAYRLFKHQRLNPVNLCHGFQILFIAMFAFLCLAYTFCNNLSFTLTQILLFSLAVICLPILFHHTINSKWDRKFGELSYPTYLTHISVIRLLAAPPLAKWIGSDFKGSFAHAASVTLVTLLLSWLLSRSIDKRIDSFRQSRVPNPRTPARSQS